MADEIAIRDKQEVSLTRQDKIDIVRDRLDTVIQLYKDVLIKDVHYGVIPGTAKPSLLKAGAEKVILMFQFVPTYKPERIVNGVHREYIITCSLSTASGVLVGEGLGSCSTEEKKYAKRKACLICPTCGKDTVIKGKVEYGGGYVCFAKKGGCGVKFADNDTKITSQAQGEIDNPDIADTYNTVLKMAKKRALVDAVLTVAGVSDVFTQDVEDFVEYTYAPIVEVVEKEKPKEEVKAEEKPKVKTAEEKAEELKVLRLKHLDHFKLYETLTKVQKDLLREVYMVKNMYNFCEIPLSEINDFLSTNQK
jgi:hypothetical protein